MGVPSSRHSILFSNSWWRKFSKNETYSDTNLMQHQCTSEKEVNLNFKQKASGRRTWRNRRRSVRRRIRRLQRRQGVSIGRDKAEKVNLYPTDVVYPAVDVHGGCLAQTGRDLGSVWSAGPQVEGLCCGPEVQGVRRLCVLGPAGLSCSPVSSVQLRSAGLVDPGQKDLDPGFIRPGLVAPIFPSSGVEGASSFGIPRWPEIGNGNLAMEVDLNNQQGLASFDRNLGGGCLADDDGDGDGLEIEHERRPQIPSPSKPEQRSMDFGQSGGNCLLPMLEVEKGGGDDRAGCSGTERVSSGLSKARFRQVYRRKDRVQSRGSCEVGVQRVWGAPRLKSIVIKSSLSIFAADADVPSGSVRARGEVRLLRRCGSEVSVGSSPEFLAQAWLDSDGHEKTSNVGSLRGNGEGWSGQEGECEQVASFLESDDSPQLASRVSDSLEKASVLPLDSCSDRVNGGSESETYLEGSSDEEGMWRMQGAESVVEEESSAEEGMGVPGSSSKEAEEGGLRRREVLANAAKSVEVSKVLGLRFSGGVEQAIGFFTALEDREEKGLGGLGDRGAEVEPDLIAIQETKLEVVNAAVVSEVWDNRQVDWVSVASILPPSAHAVTSTASKFLLKWMFQYEHEHRQWSAAIALGLISNCLHATDRKQKVEIITGLLEVACSNKSTLVKGACGVGLGFTCQDLLTRVETDGDSNLLEETGRMREASLLGKIVRALSLMICQLSSSSSNSLESLCKYFPLGTDDMDTDTTFEMSSKNFNNLDEDVWGVAGLIMGLGSSVSAIYRAGSHDVVLKIKALITSWIPHVNPLIHNSCICSENLEIPLSVGSCLALPIVVAFCQRVELMDGDELDHFVNGYRELISELISVKKSGIFHQSLLMASCIGAGTLLSGILDEGVHSIKAEYVKGLLELFRDSYTNPYPPIIHLGGMLGVVNALGAGAGTLNHLYHQSSLQTGYEQKESSYIRGPILSSPVCEQLSTSLIQEIFLVAQDSKEHQLQRYAAWAVSFLRHRWWSKELQTVKNSSQSDTIGSKHVSQSFPEDSIVWRLSLWLRDLDCSRVAHLSKDSAFLVEALQKLFPILFAFIMGGSIAHVNTVTTILRCLSRAPRLPSLDWGAIIRRCMRYEAQGSEKLFPDSAVERGDLREQCILFSLAHANQFDPLLFFLDELSDLSRFRTLELNLQSCLLCHLAELIKIFSGSRQEKLFDDMADYLCSSASSYQVYNPDQQSLLQVSFWKGLYHSLEEASTESSEYISNMEKCMELLFTLLPALYSDASLSVDLANSVKEWSEAIKCLGKARRGWLMDLLEVPEVALVQGGGKFIELVKRIQARARLVRIGCIPLSELGKLKAYILNTKSDGIWDVLVEVVAALQYAEGSIKRQWLADAVEISCITKYPSTVGTDSLGVELTLQFLGLLSGSCCKYMPLLTLDRVTVLSDLPVTLTSLLSDRSWGLIAESVVMNLCASTKRIYNWATCLESGDDALSLRSIDESENRMAVFLTRVMHHVCVSLKDYLPLEKQLWLANMIVP
ncbi:hypothetical protein HHK36_007435 [Tetracentron sinense]|uniref:Uncharacterized protein n=1 Tax=Tetracentron sinense TaxID=13715 RepID=A0A835DLS9_TETSI|nr:hypothetical protein HHK36_007435 [Tetracentron sinense]